LEDDDDCDSVAQLTDDDHHRSSDEASVKEEDTTDGNTEHYSPTVQNMIKAWRDHDKRGKRMASHVQWPRVEMKFPDFAADVRTIFEHANKKGGGNIQKHIKAAVSELFPPTGSSKSMCRDLIEYYTYDPFVSTILRWYKAWCNPHKVRAQPEPNSETVVKRPRGRPPKKPKAGLTTTSAGVALSLPSLAPPVAAAAVSDIERPTPDVSSALASQPSVGQKRVVPHGMDDTTPEVSAAKRLKRMVPLSADQGSGFSESSASSAAAPASASASASAFSALAPSVVTDALTTKKSHKDHDDDKDNKDVLSLPSLIGLSDQQRYKLLVSIAQLGADLHQFKPEDPATSAFANKLTAWVRF
jgi:hypothetical protein